MKESQIIALIFGLILIGCTAMLSYFVTISDIGPVIVLTALTLISLLLLVMLMGDFDKQPPAEDPHSEHTMD